MISSHIFNRKELKPLRSQLRKNSTSAEATLWSLLKLRKLEGRKFRRQYSIDKYIADFYCPSEKLVIELDGARHGEYRQIEKDIKRDKFFEDLGMKVIRFENRFVFQDPDYVLDEINKAFGRNEQNV